jgi:ABC-type multidrug transport system fused ATPase/permease subunit
MRYSAFGLTLSASHPIPRLASAASTTDADVHVELGRRPAWLPSAHLAKVRYTSPYHDAGGTAMLTLGELENGWLRLSFADGTDFLVDRPGRNIWAAWPDHLTIDDASSYLLGPVMGFVLRLRGSVCLHASAVAVDGRAFALVGHPGAGKSTTLNMLSGLLKPRSGTV